MTTASFMRGINETNVLQNRTYIVTTILVSLRKKDRLRDFTQDGRASWEGNSFSFSFMIEFLKVQAPERIQQTYVILSVSLPSLLSSFLLTSLCLTGACSESQSLYLASTIEHFFWGAQAHRLAEFDCIFSQCVLGDSTTMTQPRI